MILGRTELRNIFNKKKGVWCKGQLGAMMQVKIGTKDTTSSIHSLIKEFQKNLQQKEQERFALAEITSSSLCLFELMRICLKYIF